MKLPPGTIEINLQPGEFYFGAARTRIRTLLGSCIAITMWHPRRLIGGMCHYMLPSRPSRGHTLEGKYAEEAMELFIQKAEQNNTRLKEYEIKIFGGGHMFPEQTLRHKNSVSEKNIEAAHRILAQHDLAPTSQDVGLTGHRHIIFDVWNGNVWVRYQPQSEIKKHL